ncbi:hypothetical protein AMTRI_Chr01g134030 [Amborella trichopoda]|uniref:Uncharacterized protein n=1 Tax=Amborella trichopoda TaxID=13333 RepID=W1Q132_AMBTC|nr:O-acyltransferase WSD1 [Amborella trichopoda]ERN14120.1 hypothetical protein AMTR_s00021p00243800 [Amborella trichopoda]|eukprot:XP_006852653.1 O-acyltransferase WSD1 [Amborella trichopoda]
METEEPQPLSPAARLFKQPLFNCSILCMLGLGKKVTDIEAVMAGLERTMARHPRFSSIVKEDSSGKQQWVRTNVVMEDHIITQPFDEDQEANGADLIDQYITKLSTTPLDMSKPLWELHILNLKTDEAEATAIFRIHHSLGDGISLMSLLMACTRKTSDPDSLPSVPQRKEKPLENRSGLLSILSRIWVIFLTIWYTLMDLLLFIPNTLFLKDTDTPIKGLPGVEKSPKKVVHLTLSLDDMKKMKYHVNGTLNDVMLGITSAGLVKYLARRYELSKENHNGKTEKPSFPQNIHIRSSLLVNLRSAPGLHELAEMMKDKSKKARWGNRMGYLVFKMPMLRHTDPLEYFREAKAIIDRKKMSFEPFITYFIGKLVVRLFGIKSAARMMHTALSNTTFSFSNVMGPTEEVEFLGLPIVFIAPTVYGHPHALTIHYQSYTNKVKLVICVAEETIPDPFNLCQDIADALKLMISAVKD